MGIALSPTDHEMDLSCYCDADWGTCSFSRRSLTGYFTFLGNYLVSWKTKKKKTVYKSSTESGFRSKSQTTSEPKWLDGVMSNLKFIFPKHITLLCDNKSAEYIAQHSAFQERTKHLDVDCCYVREKLQEGFLTTQHVRTTMQLVDIMTKAIS